MSEQQNENGPNLAGQWCGQTQPHGPHRWAPSMYQSTSTFWRECAGHLSIRVADDPLLLDPDCTACNCGSWDGGHPGDCPAVPRFPPEPTPSSATPEVESFRPERGDA